MVWRNFPDIMELQTESKAEFANGYEGKDNCKMNNWKLRKYFEQ